uniref:Centrosome-associated zinc finger protein CP190 n=1 Tax=Stomoxys calcitrans TaxID=35570 RepID=A0A1I8PRU6_STOCA
MGEIKSVKVDNWGVFFLQKLQNFFNKTDYCDLTLQFRDNSQLKVHRLVLSACTDYFNVLEQTCEVVDDAIIMPNGLQADVVVPIVNFMYTGTLEFELKMYNRLLRTAKDMNMTVLLKLLEAHRRTMEMHPQKNQAPTSPKTKRKIIPTNSGPGVAAHAGGRSLIQPQNKRIMVTGNVPQNRVGPSSAHSRIAAGTSGHGNLPVKQQIGSTTFTRIKQETDSDNNANNSSGGYTLLKKPLQPTAPASPFEQLRKGYNNNKRPATATFVSPPAKKPNLEDVKEFAEQQRMRKQIAAEFGDDGDYDTGIMDDDTIHNDDDDDDMTAPNPISIGQQQQQSSSTAVQTSASQHQQTEDPPGTTTIIVKHEGPDKPPTIVVKDSSNSKMNHAKIISEVLRQYPHLVNSNKNIKLKIMPNAGGNAQKVVVKKEVCDIENTTTAALAAPPSKLSMLQKVDAKVSNIIAVPNKPKQQVLGHTMANTAAKAANEVAVKSVATSEPVAALAPAQKRRIDSKTMHALIALGAENTTGPWLCLRCGRNGHPISIPSYRGFRRHLINTHKETIDPALCEHCGWRSSSKRELHFHMQLEHKIRTNLYIFPECQLCNQMCIDSDALNQHLIDSHPDENKQQCIYCNKIFPEELQLYTHMKTFHKKQALEDGIIDYSDDENANTGPIFPPPEDEEMLMEEEVEAQQQPEKKIKILSDISLPIAGSIMKADTFSAAVESTTTLPSEEYLQEQEHVETKFVAADGSEVILTAEQRKEILSQLNQENEGSSGVVMVLNENQQFVGGETQSEQGAISHDETSQATSATNEEPDDSHIYHELKSQTSEAIEEDTASQSEQDAGDHHEGGEQEDQAQEEKMQHEHLDESKESIDNLEWAENLVSEHDMADVSSNPAEIVCGGDPATKEEEQPRYEEEKSQDEISKKLKELAGEWSEDEEEDMPEDVIPTEKPRESEVLEKAQPPEEEVNTSALSETEKIMEDITVNTKQISETEKQKEETAEEDTQKSHMEKEIPKGTETEKASVEESDDDDVDLALKNLHSEDHDDKQQSQGNVENKPEGDEKSIAETVAQHEGEEELKDEDAQEVREKDTTEESNKEKSVEVKTPCGEDTESDPKEEKNEAAQDSNAETITDKKEVSEIKNEADTECGRESRSTSEEKPADDEFLDITPEKVQDDKGEDNSATATTPKDPEEASNLESKDVNPTTSEDRVKSLISEWGDDDDEEENDTEEKPNP